MSALRHTGNHQSQKWRENLQTSREQLIACKKTLKSKGDKKATYTKCRKKPKAAYQEVDIW